jgi:iron-sulfur cluster assembly accessory protein
MTTTTPITLTPRALEAATRLAREDPQYAGRPLRIYIDGKGCDGFFYGVAFDERLDADVAFSQGELTLVIDREALRFMDGSTVDWVDDERGRGFLVDNPQHRKYRGKFFKRRSWVDELQGKPPLPS